MSGSHRAAIYVLLLVGSILYFGRHATRLRSGEAYRAVVAWVESDERVAEVLGPGASVGPFPRGGSNGGRERSRAFTVGVHGPRGDGRAEVEVEQFGTLWRVARASLVADGVRHEFADADVEPLRRARRLVSRGYALHQRGRQREALEAFDRALRADPENTYSLFWRGWTHIALGRPDDAAQDLRRVLAIDSAYSGGYRALGIALGRAGRYEASLEQLNRAVERRPECGSCWFSRAVTHQDLGRDAEMRSDLETACALDYGDACAALEAMER